MRIVLLHGALGAAEQVEPLAKELEHNGFAPDILELPGHGNTPLGTVDFSIVGFADWLKRAVEEKNLQHFPFFGFSMGGYIALYLNAQKRILSREIITLGTKFDWSNNTAEEEAKKLDPGKIQEKVPKFAEMLDKRHNDWQEVIKKTEGLMRLLGGQPLIDENEIKQIKNRVLIMRGEKDEMVTKGESEKIADWLPDGNYKEMPALPHPLEKIPPQKIVLEIKKFLGLK